MSAPSARGCCSRDGEGVVDHEHEAARLRDVGEGREIREVHVRVRGRLGVDHARRGRDVARHVREVAHVGEAEAEAELRVDALHEACEPPYMLAPPTTWSPLSAA
jgi:hypothetical protein